MLERWTNWRSFQNSKFGSFIEAPISAGVYEIRRASDRVSMVLAWSENLAKSLSAFVMRGKERRRFLLLRYRTPYAAGEIEYRIWPAPTASEAKVILDLIRAQRSS